MELKILNQNKEVLFQCKGQSIDCVYRGEYSEGDKILLSAPGTEFVRIKLDKTLKEAVVFMPNGSLEL